MFFTNINDKMVLLSPGCSTRDAPLREKNEDGDCLQSP